MMMAPLRRPKVEVRSPTTSVATLLPLLLSLLLLLQGTAPRASAATNHGSDRRQQKGSSEEGRLGKLGSAATTAALSQEQSPGLVEDPAGQQNHIDQQQSKTKSRHLEVTLDLSEEGAEEVDDGLPIDEPPVLSLPMPDKWVQRCSNFQEVNFQNGADCGAPLSEPCFDGSCLGGAAGDAPLAKIYVYDQECTLVDSAQMAITDHGSTNRQHQSSYWREAVWNAGMLADTYDEACLFIHVNTHNHDQPCAAKAPRWNGGVNHVMMEFTPWWNEQSSEPSMSNTYAMDWAFDSLSCYYRSGFDLSLPLVPKKLFPHLASASATDREYFMTFKGSIYLGGFGVEERQAVTRVHDPANGIVSIVKCSNMHGEKDLPENLDYCQRSQRRYDSFDYERLMNATFALVPAGRSPGSFRLGEIMSAGAIPVFVVRDWIKPFQEQIDWASFSFSVTPDNVGPALVETLRAVPPEQLKEMQRKSLEAFWRIFGGVTDYSVIAANSIDALTQRLSFHR